MENISHNTFEVNHSFYEKYNNQIRIIVSRILNNAEQTNDIDDCVNDVYLELMAKLQQYNETRGSMAAFVAIIARSTALDYCRGNKNKPGELIGDEKFDYIIAPMEVENKLEYQMLVDSILEKLNEQEGILFTMKYILFYSPDEIAKSFKIKRNAVDARVNRLKSKVKNFLLKGGIII